MFNIFKQIKQLKMTKQELEQQVTEMQAALVRTNTANKELVDQLNKMDEQLSEAIARVKHLDGQIKMMDAQRIAATKYSDTSKNY
jgi:regulator of replication initiation timing